MVILISFIFCMSHLWLLLLLKGMIPFKSSKSNYHEFTTNDLPCPLICSFVISAFLCCTTHNSVLYYGYNVYSWQLLVSELESLKNCKLVAPTTKQNIFLLCEYIFDWVRRNTKRSTQTWLSWVTEHKHWSKRLLRLLEFSLYLCVTEQAVMTEIESNTSGTVNMS